VLEQYARDLQLLLHRADDLRRDVGDVLRVGTEVGGEAGDLVGFVEQLAHPCLAQHVQAVPEQRRRVAVGVRRHLGGVGDVVARDAGHLADLLHRCRVVAEGDHLLDPRVVVFGAQRLHPSRQQVVDGIVRTAGDVPIFPLIPIWRHRVVSSYGRTFVPVGTLVSGSKSARSRYTWIEPVSSARSRDSSTTYDLPVFGASVGGSAFSLPAVLLPRIDPQPGWRPDGFFFFAMPARVRIVHAVALQFSPSELNPMAAVLSSSWAALGLSPPNSLAIVARYGTFMPSMTLVASTRASSLASAAAPSSTVTDGADGSQSTVPGT
jgi:hypothetical protein